MNWPLPDINNMNSDQVIRWALAISILFQYGFMYGELQARAREHQQLLMAAQVQCVNDAELVIHPDIRAVQLRRCLTLKIEIEPEK